MSEKVDTLERVSFFSFIICRTRYSVYDCLNHFCEQSTEANDKLLYVFLPFRFDSLIYYYGWRYSDKCHYKQKNPHILSTNCHAVVYNIITHYWSFTGLFFIRKKLLPINSHEPCFLFYRNNVYTPKFFSIAV